MVYNVVCMHSKGGGAWGLWVIQLYELILKVCGLKDSLNYCRFFRFYFEEIYLDFLLVYALKVISRGSWRLCTPSLAKQNVKKRWTNLMTRMARIGHVKNIFFKYQEMVRTKKKAKDIKPIEKKHEQCMSQTSKLNVSLTV